MSETAGTIIKLLAALTSPKACVKYITVAVTLLISWKYLEPVISETQISKEQLSIVLLLLGVGCGSLVGQAISWVTGATKRDYGFDRFWRNARTHTLHDPLDYKLRDLGRWVLRGEYPLPTSYS